MKSQGQARTTSVLFWGAGIALSILIGVTSTAFASSLTIRDIQVKGNQVEIQLDGAVSSSAVELEYVRDIVQFSLQNTTLYPAKILHVDDQAFTKVFAYQYAPSLVRVRLSVEGKADDFRNQVKWSQKGKTVTITFPKSAVKQAKTEDHEKHEKSLLAKVLAASRGPDNVKVEPISQAVAEKTEKSERAAEKVEKANLASGKNSLGKEGHPISGTMKSNGPSALRSFFAMFLIVGSLGLVLIYVKKRSKGAQAKRVGESWLSGFLPQGMRKQKSFIEVVGTHPIGPKQSIVVVRIRGQQFVLGVTQDNVQLISQIDADENEADLLEDPAVAASIGKLFGGNSKVEPAPKTKAALNASFASFLKKSGNDENLPQKVTLKAERGVNESSMRAIGRNAYRASLEQPEGPAIHAVTSSAGPAINIPTSVGAQGLTQIPEIRAQQNGIRDQIRKRLEGMKNV